MKYISFGLTPTVVEELLGELPPQKQRIFITKRKLYGLRYEEGSSIGSLGYFVTTPSAMELYRRGERVPRWVEISKISIEPRDLLRILLMRTSGEMIYFDCQRSWYRFPCGCIRKEPVRHDPNGAVSCSSCDEGLRIAYGEIKIRSCAVCRGSR
jgi:hypothetical protein